MYKVKVDGNTIYNPASSDLVIIDPKLTLEVNNAGEFEFVMPPTHPLYGSVERLSSVVTVEEDGSIIFEGRVTEESVDFWKRKSYHCEGCLAYLKDTKQPPAEYHGMTVRQYLGVLLNVHNAKVSADKRFTLGAVTVTDSNDSLYRYTNWESTLQCINDDLIKSLGGYLRIRYEDGTRYLDYLAEFPNTNSQIIRFGRNLLDYASSYDTSDYCTVLIPQGAELEESEIPALHMRLGIEDVNGGSPYLVNDDAVKEHGWIERVVEWDGVTSAPVLLTKARKYLSDVQFDSMVLTIKAVDLHKLNPEIESIKLLDEIRAISKPHGMNRIFPVTKVSIPLDNTSGAEYTLGTKVTYSLTSTTEAANEDILNRIKRAKTPQEILESAQDNASALIKSALNGYVVITDDASELLVMDTPDINTARKVWRWNLNGLGYSNNGYDGDYGLAITMDGAIVADYITAGTLNANLLKAGRIQDAQGYNYWDLQTGDFHLLALQDYAQKANTIVNTTPQYAVSTSSTTAPTGGWSTETPTWEAGKYVWFRLQMINGNNQAVYSAAVCIQGAKGEAGTSVTILGSYNTLAELQAAHPTGNLGDSYMVGSDLYVWNGTQWEDVGQIKGDDGRDATQYYTYFAYATSSDGSQGFSTTPFAGAVYMGVCTVTSATQPQTYSTYTWSRAKGEQGIGVTDTVTQYYLSTSSTTQSGGSWSENEPTWESGYYIWTRQKITWSSWETTYTSPVLAKAINGANEKAASAESTAATAESTANSASETASNAQATANSAQTAADNAQSTADSATTAAANAQRTANTANTNAGRAQSTANAASTAAANAQSTADDAAAAVTALDDSLYTTEIFNRLTNNGQVQGIIMQNGNLYVNASYINSGTMSADRIQGGTYKVGGRPGQEYGYLYVYDVDGNVAGFINQTGITMDNAYFGDLMVDSEDGKAYISLQVRGSGTSSDPYVAYIVAYDDSGEEIQNIPVNIPALSTTDFSATQMSSPLVIAGTQFEAHGLFQVYNYNDDLIVELQERQGAEYGSTLYVSDTAIKRLSFKPFGEESSGTWYRPIGSYGTNGNRVKYISAHSSSHSVPNSLGVNAQFGSTSAYSTKNFAPSSSDIRLKENVKDCEIEALPFIQKIRMRQFDWKRNGIHQDCGFVADELEQLDENLSIGGGYEEDGTMNEKSVNDFYLLGYMVKAMQEMQAEIDYLKGVVKDGINRRVD